MMQQVFVYIVDDHQAVRDSLRMLVRSAGMEVKSFASAEELLEQGDLSVPACLLVDVRMPGMSGLELQQALVERGVGLPMIVMSAHADVPMAVKALKAGALDFFEKPFDNEQLLASLHNCICVARTRASGSLSAISGQDCLGELTAREREVFDLLVLGKSNKAVAAMLDISTRTAEVHRAHVMRKLSAKSVVDLVRIAMG